LVSKLRRRYWERPCCQGAPLLLIVAPFHEPGSQTYIDESLARYLFGIQRYNDWTEYGGILVREAPVLSHSVGNKTIPSRFFTLEDAQNISGVVWANQFTVSKFLRMAAEAQGLPRELHSATIRGVRCAPVHQYIPHASRPAYSGRPRLPSTDYHDVFEAGGGGLVVVP